MLHNMFYFGVILPTTVLVMVFIFFLVCWFRCGFRERFTANQNFEKRRSHNSTHSSLVTTSSGLPYPHGPPSKDYWEVDLQHDTSLDRRESKYIPGEFSVRLDDWIYMSHDQAQKMTGNRNTETETCAQVHVLQATESETSSLVSNSSSGPCLDGRVSPDEIFISSSSCSSPDSVSKLQQDRGLTLRVVDSPSNQHWQMLPNPDNLPHRYPATVSGFEFTDTRQYQTYSVCSPYAVTNLIQVPAPAIRV